MWGGVWQDSIGYIYQRDAWADVWPTKLWLYRNGENTGMETYRIRNGQYLESGVKTKAGLDLAKYRHIYIEYKQLINRSDSSHIVIIYKTATGIKNKSIKYTDGVIQQERIEVDAGLEYVSVAYAENTGWNHDTVTIGSDSIEIAVSPYGSIYIYKLWLES